MKLALLGDPTVGKTSLRRHYLGEGFKTNYIATIGADFTVKEIKLEGKIPTVIHTAIWDIAGQTMYQDLAKRFYKGASGALILYDVTNPESFTNIKSWIDRFQQNSSFTPNSSFLPPIALIGNKIDLDHDIDDMQQISMMQNLSHLYPTTPFYSFRTSAKTGEQVDEAFSMVISAIIDQLQQDEQFKGNETEAEVKMWQFSENYKQIEFVQCRNCELYIEHDPHQIHCPHCDKIMVVKQRFIGYARKNRNLNQ